MRVSPIKLLESCQAHCRGSINVSYCCETFRPFYLCDIASSFLLPFEVAVIIKFILQMRKQALSESCSRSLCKQPADDLNSGFLTSNSKDLPIAHTLSHSQTVLICSSPPFKKTLGGPKYKKLQEPSFGQSALRKNRKEKEAERKGGLDNKMNSLPQAYFLPNPTLVEIPSSDRQ